MIEFVLVLPLLLLLTFGMVEFAIMLYNQQVITNASREGARLGIVVRDPTQGRVTPGEITAEVNAYCAGNLITFKAGGDSARVTTAMMPAPPTGTEPARPTGTQCGRFGDDLTVTVEFDYTFLLFPNILTKLFSGSIDDPFELTGRSTMRCE